MIYKGVKLHWQLIFSLLLIHAGFCLQSSVGGVQNQPNSGDLRIL